MVFKRIFFQNRFMVLDPPPFMANAILNFHFDYLNPSLRCSLNTVQCFKEFCFRPAEWHEYEMFSANWNWGKVAPTNGKRRLIGPTIADFCAGFKWQEQRWGPAGSFIAAILASSHVSQERSPTKHFQIRKGRTLQSGSFGEEQSLFYPFSEPTAKASAEGATELSNRCLYSPTPRLSGIPHFLALESPIAWFNF